MGRCLVILMFVFTAWSMSASPAVCESPPPIAEIIQAVVDHQAGTRNARLQYVMEPNGAVLSLPSKVSVERASAECEWAFSGRKELFLVVGDHNFSKKFMSFDGQREFDLRYQPGQPTQLIGFSVTDRPKGFGGIGRWPEAMGWRTPVIQGQLAVWLRRAKPSDWEWVTPPEQHLAGVRMAICTTDLTALKGRTFRLSAGFDAERQWATRYVTLISQPLTGKLDADVIESFTVSELQDVQDPILHRKRFFPKRVLDSHLAVEYTVTSIEINAGIPDAEFAPTAPPGVIIVKNGSALNSPQTAKPESGAVAAPPTSAAPLTSPPSAKPPTSRMGFWILIVSVFVFVVAVVLRVRQNRLQRSS